MKDTNINKLNTFYKKYKRMPGYAEFMKLFSYKSKNSVFKLINKFTQAGVVIKDKQGRLSPGNIFGEIKMLGLVEAGWPSPAEEELTDTITLDDFLIRNKEATYMLTVKGDSMKDAGIMDGDLVLVERGAEARSGAIILAQIDNEWTIKYLRQQGGKTWLEPANASYKKLFPKESLKIAAVVKAVIRKY